MDARTVKDALYGRHPGGGGQFPGPWTCIEEYRAIDLLAFSAWSSASRYARIGYEVKVSRSDLRAELLKPHKRARNVEWCNEFYVAVPAGMLTDEERAWKEPDWQPEDFTRTPCPNRDLDWHAEPGPCRRGKRKTLFIGPLRDYERYYRPHVNVRCEVCGGRGYIEKSRVELESPTLWIPRDVGLIEVNGRGTTVVKRSPRRDEVPTLHAMEITTLVRWVSMRPDPRHRGHQAIEAAA